MVQCSKSQSIYSLPSFCHGHNFIVVVGVGGGGAGAAAAAAAVTAATYFILF
jgi:hypothetical protein